MLLYTAFGIWIILLGVVIGNATGWDFGEMLPLGIPALVIGPLIILLSVSNRVAWAISAAAWSHLFISFALSPLAIPAAWINTDAGKALFLDALYILLFILFPIAVIVTRRMEKKAIAGRRGNP